ncbi:glycosyltransferase family 2 protein [Psychrobacter faecalis]|uniref:glycosyltransferase family 2 protein n=1 Tax=Psychrobacter faecalis TaxID=180588 RepID=UPI001919100E|nr:glycosyltransferase [Psychrobacter faecalis]
MDKNVEKLSSLKLRTQKEILDSWNCSDESTPTPLVSINCITYNHEKYIEDAIVGFLKQETDFPFEILINDDASTDGTSDIIRKYEERYPAIIKACYHQDNKYSKGFSPSYFNLDRAKGYYFATCVGDDYWISKTHLQDAICCMEKDKNLSIYGSACYLQRPTETKVYKYSKNYYNLSSFIIEAPFVPTCSLVVKTSNYRKIQELFVLGGRYFAGDTRLKLLSLTQGCMYINNNPSVVYRNGVEGSWTNRAINKEVVFQELLDNIAITREVKHFSEYDDIDALLKRVQKEYIIKYASIAGLHGNYTWLKFVVLHLKSLSKDTRKSVISYNPIIKKLLRLKKKYHKS